VSLPNVHSQNLAELPSELASLAPEQRQQLADYYGSLPLSELRRRHSELHACSPLCAHGRDRMTDELLSAAIARKQLS
jgi:hypothetical protein